MQKTVITIGRQFGSGGRLHLNDGIPRTEAADLAVKMNKKRASYYNYYTDKKWGHITSYHLTIDSSVLGIDPTVELIAGFVRSKMGMPGKG